LGFWDLDFLGFEFLWMLFAVLPGAEFFYEIFFF
jgi:hypothetical protein